MAASFGESVQSPTSPALDPKERFYRYFQEEATGKFKSYVYMASLSDIAQHFKSRCNSLNTWVL